MSYLCIKKQEPTAGAKGILCGGVFLPIESYESERPTPASQIPSEGLTLYVPLSEESSTAETGQALTSNGTITYQTYKGISCITKGDTDAYLSVPLSVEGVFTLSFWINTTYTGEYIGMAYVGGLCIFDASSNSSFQFSAKKGSSERANFTGISKPLKWRDGAWHYIALSVTSTESKLYCDGTLISIASGVNISTSSNAYIGWDNDGDNAAASYARWRVYNRALSDAEIALLAREFVFNSAPLAGRKGLLVPVGESVSAPPGNGLVFYAPLSEESSTAETGQALTKTGIVTYQTVEGLPCARFDATNSYLSATVPNMAGVLTGTISLWIYVSNDAGKYSTDYPRFFTFGDKSKPNNGFICGTWAKPGGVINYQSNNSSNAWPSANNPLRKGRWINFVATITESGFLQSYVNGSEGSFCETGAITINEPSVYINYINGDYGIDGIYIADVRMYNRILSASEIQSLAFEHNPTKSLFIPLQTAYGTPQAGQKGIIVRSSQVVGHATYSKSAEAMPTEGLVFYLPCDSDSYTTAQTGQTLSKSGTVTATTVNGIPCLEIKSGSYLNGTLDGFSGDVSMAMSFWFKRLNSNSSAYITAGRGNYSLSGGDEIWASVESDHIETACGSSNSDARRAGILYSEIGTDWHHGYFCYDATSKKYKTVMDGDTDYAAYSAERSYSFQSGLNFCINSLARATYAVGGNANYSRIRIFNRALTDAEIKTLAGEYKQEEVKKMFIAVKEQSAIPDDGLIFYASLSEESSTAETGQALSKNGTVTYGTESGIPCAFNNGNGYLDFSASGLITMSSDWAISLWIRFNSFSGQCPTAFAMGSSHGIGTAIRVCYYNGELCFEPVSLSPDSNSINTPSLNVWYHICIVHSGTKTIMYSDGVQKNEKSFTYSFTPSSGKIGNSLGNNEYFNGWISAVRIYNRALDSDEISALANEYTPEA